MRLLAICLALVVAQPALAQSWATTTSDDGGYAAGFVRFPGLGAGFTCTARSVQQKPIIDTGWFESTTADPWHFLLWFDEALIPVNTFERSDLIYYVGQTGYRLPLTYHNELEGGWQVPLPMTDGLFAALASADRLVLAVGNQKAWELPFAGLGSALEQARAFCAATWAVTGPPPPPGLVVQAGPAAPPAPQPGTFALPPQVQADVSRKCEGPATIRPDALQAGDLDGDGRLDVVVNYRDVVCPGHRLNPFCGAANCSIDIYLSSRGYTSPEFLLGTSSGIVPHRSGRLALKINGTYGLCGDTGCDAPFVWTGTKLEQLP